MSTEPLPSVNERQRVASPDVTPQALAWHKNALWMGSRDSRRIYGIEMVGRYSKKPKPLGYLGRLSQPVRLSVSTSGKGRPMTAIFGAIPSVEDSPRPIECLVPTLPGPI